jgi:hypothetical protein
VYRGTVAGGSKTQIASGVTSSSSTDSNNLVSGQMYSYQVSARTATAESSLSNEASARAR